MSSSTLTIRIDDDLKRGASEVADYYGLDLSSVTRAFYKQMVNTRRIPLTFAPDEPSMESLEAIREVTPSCPLARKAALTTQPISSPQRWPNEQAHGGFLRCILSRPQEEGKTAKLGFERAAEAHRPVLENTPSRWRLSSAATTCTA